MVVEKRHAFSPGEGVGSQDTFLYICISMIYQLQVVLAEPEALQQGATGQSIHLGKVVLSTGEFLQQGKALHTLQDIDEE
jgi:hypothetical protein